MIDVFHELEPFSLDRDEKRELLLGELKELTAFHDSKCQEYHNWKVNIQIWHTH